MSSRSGGKNCFAILLTWIIQLWKADYLALAIEAEMGVTLCPFGEDWGEGKNLCRYPRF